MSNLNEGLGENQARSGGPDERFGGYRECSECHTRFNNDIHGEMHADLRECEAPDCSNLVCWDCHRCCHKCQAYLCGGHAIEANDEEEYCLSCHPEYRKADGISLEPLEIAAAIEALKLYGPARMGNHDLFYRLLGKLEAARG